MANLIIDQIYPRIKSKFKMKEFSFGNLWDEVLKNFATTDRDIKDKMGSFYTDILQDNRFVITGLSVFKLREFMTLDELHDKKVRNFVNDFEDDELIPKHRVFETDFEPRDLEDDSEEADDSKIEKLLEENV